jgi:hypothetical protein
MAAVPVVVLPPTGVVVVPMFDDDNNNADRASEVPVLHKAAACMFTVGA